MRSGTWLLALALCAGFGARAAGEDAAAAEWQRLDREKLAQEDAVARVRELAASLERVGLPRTAVVALAALSADAAQSEQVRLAARAELARRAAQDRSVAEPLLARLDAPGKLTPALALRLARLHLESALQLSPIEEGIAFEGLSEAPALANASVETRPLDDELAAEMGAARGEGTSAQTLTLRAGQPEPGRASQRELDRARALASSVPPGDPAEVEAHEVAGLAALAAGDADVAEKEFLAVARAPVPRGQGTERRDVAYLQLARLAYQRGDDSRSAALYEKVSSGAPEWLDALFEASWAHFRKADDERALGNLLTLHAPFFQGRFFPESFILKALVLYENCRYGDARRAVEEFERNWRPVHDGLAAALARLRTPQQAYELLAGGAVQLQQVVPMGAREEVARIEREADLEASAKAVAELAQEIDSFDRRSPAFRSSAFARRIAPAAREARLHLLEWTGRRLIARLSAERAELRELLGQSLRLAYEIAGREKELAAGADGALGPAKRRELPHVEDDEVLWPFEGEYWRDELGSYRYQLGERCRKARRAPIQAREPSPAPPAVAAEPR